MKFAAKSLLFPIVLAATFAFAQTLPHFQHIIIVVQENRTPDNLFGGNPSTRPCGTENPFETGVDIESGGYVKGQNQIRCLIQLPLSAWDATLNNGTLVDPDHGYQGWGPDYDGGSVDGFCHKYGTTCPEYSYVPKSDVQPYFDIATNYGFANYMFQSNQGPSFPAHQFLFSGTSAPVAPGDSIHYSWDFVIGNADFNHSGCPYTGTGGWPQWVKPNGNPIGDPRNSKNECYTHDSLVTDANDCSNGTNGDYCDRRIVSWAYYAPGTPSIIWDAPRGIPEVCYGQNSPYNNNACGPGPSGNSKEWSDHVRIPDQNGYTDAPIFDDLYSCKLPQVSWVIPDGRWSDHPQDGATSNITVYGPSWVGDIIDAVGNSYKNTNGNCDYWGYPAHIGTTPEPTAIFVVWDDWGGWFDHVKPFQARVNINPPPIGYTFCDPNQGQWGCGFTEGFRVPLLVVSPYTPPGYVSGACDGTFCNNDKPPYQHDFGSILAFTEHNFGMPFIDGPPDKGYADYNAPDWQPSGNIPLSDFFGSSPYNFTNISTPEDYTCFQHFAKCVPNWVPTPPDND